MNGNQFILIWAQKKSQLGKHKTGLSLLLNGSHGLRRCRLLSNSLVIIYLFIQIWEEPLKREISFFRWISCNSLFSTISDKNGLI